MSPDDQNHTEPSTVHEDQDTAGAAQKTALATTLAAGGAIVATAGSVGAQETEDVVLPATDYYPNEEFVVLTDFEERNRVEFLEEWDDDEDAFDDHDDWELYSVLVEVGGPGGRITIMAIEDNVDPNPGDRGTLGDSPSFHDTEWGLIEVEVTFNDDDDGDDDDENDDDDE